MKVASIVGARPQFVKAAVVSEELQRRDVAELLVHTGQHYDDEMSDVFFRDLGLARPAHDLEAGSGSHGQQTGRMLERIEAVLLADRPDWVLVYGDTNSTLAGALAAVKLRVPLAHVEAGLRSHDRDMPEEINRVLTDHAADVLLAPTDLAAANLRREGIDDARIEVCGDVMFDAVRIYGDKAERQSAILRRLELPAGGYVLATVHRAASTDVASNLEAIFGGLVDLARDVPVVVPLHPRTRRALDAVGILRRCSEALTVLDPVGYLDMMMLERGARLVATDSGGVQKEAFFHGRPCVVFRAETEWVELVELGSSRLVPPTTAGEVAAGLRAALHGGGTRAGQPYGDGHAARKVVARLLEPTAPA